MITSRRVRMLVDHQSGAKKGNEVVVRDYQADEWAQLGIAEVVDPADGPSVPVPADVPASAPVQPAPSRAKAVKTAKRRR